VWRRSSGSQPRRPGAGQIVRGAARDLQLLAGGAEVTAHVLPGGAAIARSTSEVRDSAASSRIVSDTLTVRTLRRGVQCAEAPALGLVEGKSREAASRLTADAMGVGKAERSPILTESERTTKSGQAQSVALPSGLPLGECSSLLPDYEVNVVFVA